jgi:polyisoprenoid-binding protein YceI
MKLFVFLAISMMVGLTGNWNADTAAAKITFSIKGPFGTVNGNFSGLKADIQFDEKDPGAGSITASVETNTVSTGVGLRNHDLTHKEEWFNSDKYPEMSFHSKKIEKTDKGFTAMGELTIKGVTKPAEIPFTFSNTGTSGVFKAHFTIKREDFNVGKPGGSVGSVVTIDLVIPVKK